MTDPFAPVDIVLPEVHDAANTASGKGQRAYVRWSAVRLIALVVAAIAGAVSPTILKFDTSGAILLVAFIVAAIAELWLMQRQPERDWYAGRAVAESAKTLAWRYAVQGEPFGPSLTNAEAEALLRVRISEVLRRGRDRMTLGLGEAIVTPEMKQLRAKPFSARRRSYLEYRTNNQRRWYIRNAKKNEAWATGLRLLLLVGEIVAVVIAALMWGRGAPVDFAGIASACIAAGAAWLALKQYSPLTSAYRVAASELALQATALTGVTEAEWAQAVADAEEAISREHTMWLASRGETPMR